MRVALPLGLLLVAAAVGLALGSSPTVVARSNDVAPEAPLASVSDGDRVCQAGESLPRGTSAIRLSLLASVGPRVAVEALAGGRVITSGAVGSAWTGEDVTVPVRPLDRAMRGTTICFGFGRSRTEVTVLGTPTFSSGAAQSSAGGSLKGRVPVEYLRRGDTSWLSLVVPVARRMGLGRAMAGTWIAPFVGLLMLALASLTAWLAIRELGQRARGHRRRLLRLRTRPIARRVPLAAWLCAVVACLNAASWSLITPPFQVPDEPNHFAYVQLLAEDGRLPDAELPTGSAAEKVVLADLHVEQVKLELASRPISSKAQQLELERDMARPESRHGDGGAGVASPEPPLYYALETIPYELGSGGSLLDQLELMRLFSAVMAGITAMFAYLFVREALPRSRAAWTVGGLAVALFPLLASMSGAVNPDAMLYAVCAAIYYCLARAFRRGLTLRLAIAIGALTAVGFLTKLNFIGFAPGVLLGLVVLAVRAARGSERAKRPSGRATRYALSLGLLIAACPIALEILLSPLFSHSGLSTVSETIDNVGQLPHRIAYIWDLYLPRLPGMPAYFPGVFTTRQLWFNGLVGLYGWDVIPFPSWVYDLALIPAGLIAGLCLRELVRRRGSLARRIPELGVYCLLGVGVMAVVGNQSYISDVVEHLEAYWEPRYLLPMIPLWGLVAAVASRGAGKRLQPALAVLLISLFLAHDLVSQLQVIARFYG